MSSFICKCGNRVSNSESPNDIEYRLYSDKEWDCILQNDTIQTWKIPFPEFNIWKCPKCHRIYIFKHGDNQAFKTYSLEE